MIALAPALLAGCASPSEYADKAADGVKGFVNDSIQDWYAFVGDVYAGMTSFILKTPTELIYNDKIQDLWVLFLEITMGALGIFCIIEGIKIVAGKSRMNFMNLLGRTAISFTGLGFVLPAMTYALHFINMFIEWLIYKAQGGIDPSAYFAQTMGEVFASGGLNFLTSIVFLILFIYYMFTILLYYGRRWFDIMVSAIISPLAFAAIIFDSTSHYFQKWWAHISQLYLIQIVHAVYLMVISTIVLSPNVFATISDGLFMVILLAGALWRLAKPPQFISQGQFNPVGPAKKVASTVTKWKGKKGGSSS